MKALSATNLLIATAVSEMGVGIGLLAVPSVIAQVLLGATLDSLAALTVARVAGAALLALGVACWLARHDGQSSATRGLVIAVVLYNCGAVIILGAAGLGPQPVGIGLWPTVIFHAAMTAWSVTGLLRKAI